MFSLYTVYFPCFPSPTFATFFCPFLLDDFYVILISQTFHFWSRLVKLADGKVVSTTWHYNTLESWVEAFFPSRLFGHLPVRFLFSGKSSPSVTLTMVLRTPLLLHWSPSSRFCLLWIQPFVLPFLEMKAHRAGGEHLPGQTICLGIQARQEGEKREGRKKWKRIYAH